MPRRRSVNFIRDIGVDLRFNSSLVQKFINVIMERGKKNLARSIVYGALEELGKGDDKKSLELFEKAVQEVRPTLEVRSRRVGGGVYQIPVEVRSRRAIVLCFRWIIKAASKRSGKTMAKRLAAELADAAQGQGSAIREKTNVHRMAEANKAYAYYAW